MTETGKGTRFHLRVKGIDPAVAGTEYGAHLHVGPCVQGNGAAALGHYNASTATPPVVSNQTEVWLDFEVTDGGTGAGDALVPFVPVPGERSVVIHAEATAPIRRCGSAPGLPAGGLVTLLAPWSRPGPRARGGLGRARAGVDALDQHRPGVQLVRHVDIVSLAALLGAGVGRG